jgi:outer membrane receptor protein involved in Fe transport
MGSTWRFDVKSWLNKDRLLAGTIIAGVSALGLTAPAFAQSSDEIIVTGSRIPQPNLITTSPVTQVTAQDVQSQGVTRLEDLINQLPQAFAAQNSTVSNGSTGSANINLRGLGSPRTLVLIDGRRMPYGNPTNSAADINAIPTSMVERVEILTGGSSAVYGSDAVAGVVNFIMRKDFEGVEIDGQYGFYSHHNDYGGAGAVPLRDVIAARGVDNPSQFSLPPDDVENGFSRQLAGIIGVSTADQRGNVTAYVEYHQNTAILQADYDYSSCAIATPAAASWTCGGSSTAYPGRFTDFSLFDFTIDQATGNTFTPWIGARDQYNYGPLNYYQRPDERYSFGAFGHYELNSHFDVYAQLMFTDYRSRSQIAPSGDFFNTGTINCDNPLMSASQQTDVCGAAAGTPTVVPMYIGRRNVEGGGRQDDLHYETYRIVGGVRGNIVEGWDYDLAAQFSRVSLNRVYLNDFSVTRLNRALDVIDVAGVPTCRSVVDGSDPLCVPYDVFSIGGVTPEALAYLQIPLMQQATMDQQVVTGVINGDLASIGMQSPLAETGFQIAFGVEYRRDVLDSTTDTNFQSGDGAGQGGATLPVSGSTDSTDLFIEARLPLVEKRPFFELMSLDLAYRYSDYSTGITTDTYKIGGDWAPPRTSGSGPRISGPCVLRTSSSCSSRRASTCSIWTRIPAAPTMTATRPTRRRWRNAPPPACLRRSTARALSTARPASTTSCRAATRT